MLPFVDDVRRGLPISVEAAGSPRTNHTVVEVNKLDSLHRSQEQCTSKTSTFDSASDLSEKNTPVKGPIVNHPPIDKFNLPLPKLNLFGAVSSGLSRSIQTKPTRVENEILDDSQIRGNAANSKEAVEENDDGQINCIGEYVNPQTWMLPDVCLADAPSLVEDLYNSEESSSLLEFKEMLEKAKNPKKTTSELYSKQAEKPVARTENNHVPFPGPTFGLIEPLPISIAWRLGGFIPDSNPNNKGESTKHAHRISQAYQMK